MKKLVLNFSIILLLFAVSLSVKAQSWDWTKRVGVQYISDIATDNAGNTIMTGQLSPTNIIGTTTLTANSGAAYVTKIDANGNALWAVNGGGNSANGVSITYDPASGGSYLFGTYSSTNVISFGTYTVPGVSVISNFITKLDANGNFLWAKNIYGSVTSGTLTGAIKADINGNIYITGGFSGNLTIGTFQFTSYGDVDVFVAKLDSNGNLLWAKKAGGTSNEIGTDIELDSQGNCYVTGNMYEGTMYFGNLSVTIPSGNQSIFIAKYNSSGVEQFVTSARASSSNCGVIRSNKIAIDNSGNSYITGVFAGTAYFPTMLSSYTNASACPNSEDAFTAKFSPSGAGLWAKKGGSGQTDELGSALIITPNQEVITTGDFLTTGVFGSLSVIANTVGINPNAFIAKYSSSGTANSLIKNGSSGSYTKGMAIGIDANQCIYVAGTHGGTGNFGSQSITYNQPDSSVYLTKICGFANTTDAGVYITQTIGTNPMCNGAAATFSATPLNGGSNPTFQWMVNGGNVGTNSSTFTSSTLTNLDYVSCIVISDMPGVTNNPATSDPIQISVGLTPISINAYTICSGNSSTITVLPYQPGVSYLWNTGEISQSIVVSPTGTTSYSVNASLPGCTTSAANTITVNALPNVIITTSKDTVCKSSVITLTASGATTYTWNGGVTTNTRSATINIPTGFTVTGTDVNGCQNSYSKLISVRVATLTVAASPTIVCAGKPSTLTVTGATTYTWSGYSSSYNSLPLVVYPASPSGTWNVSGTNQYGCAINTVSVLVSANPNPGVSISGASPICSGKTATLQASGSAITYTWMPGGIISPSITVSPTVTTAYTVIGSTAASCTNAATSTLTIKPNPTLNSSVYSSLTCIVFTTQITANSPDPVTYNWTGTGILSGTTTKTITVNQPGDFICTVTNSITGCMTTSTNVVNSYTTTPTLTISSIPTPICAGDNAYFTISGANTYSWSTGQTTNFITTNPTVTTSYSVTGTNSYGCSSIATAEATVNPKPIISVSGASLACEGSITALYASGANSYYWSNSANTSSTAVTPSSTQTYSVIGYDTNNCRDTAYITITVNPNPVISITGNTLVCQGIQTILTANGAINFSWNTSETTNSITVTPAVSTTYTVTGTDINNCTGSSVIGVTVDNTCGEVWPGDTDADNSVNNTDLLPIGIYYSTSGVPRSTISNSWQPFTTPDWSLTQTNGENVKHADSNGDGFINSDDTLAIYLNYSQTHAKTPNSTNSSQVGTDFYFETVSQNYQSGDWVTVDVMVANSSQPISNFYGIAFTINYDASMAESGSENMAYSSSWFANPGTNALSFSKTNAIANSIYCAETKTDHYNSNGFGKIATFNFQVANSFTNTATMNFSLNNIVANDSIGNNISLNPQPFSININPLSTSIKNSISQEIITLFPNPNNGLFKINGLGKGSRVEIVDAAGKIVYQSIAPDNVMQFDLKNISQGFYFYKITGQKNELKKYGKLIIN